MKACVYVELEDRLAHSGIGASARQQRTALEANGVEVTDDPTEDGIDVLDVNTVGPFSLYHIWRAKRRGTTVVIHSHVTGEDFQESFRGSNLLAPLVKRYVRWFYNKADAVVCPSEYTKRILEDYPVEPPIYPVSNGVDIASLEGHEELRDEYRDRYGLSGTVFFAVGHVFERKGLSTFCELAQAFPDIDFVWFGEIMDNLLGSSVVKRWTRDPPDNVTFTGYIEDIRGGFGAGDVFLFPTHEENQGIAVLEAMACEKAVLVSDIPVFEEFLTDGEDCLKASRFDEYADAVERLGEDDELREELGEAARESAEAHALERVGATLKAVYEGLLGGEDDADDGGDG